MRDQEEEEKNKARGPKKTKNQNLTASRLRPGHTGPSKFQILCIGFQIQ
jgi:hypothetical protein